MNCDSLGHCHAHVKLLVSQVCDEAESVCVALSAHEVISTSLDTEQVIVCIIDDSATKSSNRHLISQTEVIQSINVVKAMSCKS